MFFLLQNFSKSAIMRRALNRRLLLNLLNFMEVQVDMDIESKVKGIIVEQLGVAEEEVIPAASFIEDLGADSLDTVELVMALEEEFDIEIPDDDAEKIATVKHACDYIKAHTS